MKLAHLLLIADKPQQLDNHTYMEATMVAPWWQDSVVMNDSLAPCLEQARMVY